MTEITRETLELAALAAGHKIYGWCMLCDARIAYADIGPEESVAWRPHLDDGDAFRLMAGLGLIIGWRPDSVVYSFVPTGWSSTEAAHDGTPADAARAAREAVVLCAAEVGRRMREGGR